MDERILEVLRTRSDAYVSGEELSADLGISRAAVWKHIRRLRNIGYVIDAHPHTGYRLISVPDKLLPEEISWNLRTHKFGKQIYSYELTDSTMNIATKLAGEGAAEGVVVFAEAQAKGRGRVGRKWVSPTGVGIYYSIILRPEIRPDETPKITLVVAVAHAAAIRKVTGLPAFIKWPNDILINDKKVCGILTELNAETDRVNFVIVGVGINVNTMLGDLPEGATSFKEEAGEGFSRIEIARESLCALEARYEVFQQKGFAPIIEEWHSYSTIIGANVEVAFRDRKIEGQAIDVDSSGALLVRLENGLQERVFAGDVVRVK